MNRNLSGQHENYDQVCWDLVFGVTLWLLCQWRNNKVFQHADYPEGTKSIIIGFVQDIVSVKERSRNGEATASKSEMMIGWERPKSGYVKLNTDRCSKQNSSQVSAGSLL